MTVDETRHKHTQIYYAVLQPNTHIIDNNLRGREDTLCTTRKRFIGFDETASNLGQRKTNLRAKS